MTEEQEARWRQRLRNFGTALAQLERAVAKDSYTELELAGLVQTFEFTFELAWKTLKDRLQEGGVTAIAPRDAIRKALESELISPEDTETLLFALDKRNLLSHTYREEIAREAEGLITLQFAPALRNVHDELLGGAD